MSEKSRICSGLRKAAKGVKSENILDVFVFGSFVKGKARPGDVDVCMVFLKDVNSSKVDEFYSRCKRAGINAHVSPLAAENFFLKPHSLATTVLYEGISLLDGKPAAKRFGLEAWAIYSYEISGMGPSEKVKFVHVMKGRGKNKGFVRNCGGAFLSPGCFLVPVDKDGEIMEVLEYWKVKYIRKSALLMG